jgi:hypothetical protein
VDLVRRDEERKKVNQVEVIGTGEKLLLQMRKPHFIVFASFDEEETKKLKAEIDEWLADTVVYPREKKSGFPLEK